MRYYSLILLSLLALATAQVPTPSDPPPEIPDPETPPSPMPPKEPEPVPSKPVPVDPKPTPPATPPAPTVTGAPGQGPICECGYTYCAAVLMSMSESIPFHQLRCKWQADDMKENPWSSEQLAKAYCSTPNAVCGNNGVAPATNVSSALYLCRCESDDAKLGTDLDLICGCDTCLNIGPDYRGRCETPCNEGACVKSDNGGDNWY